MMPYCIIWYQTGGPEKTLLSILMEISLPNWKKNTLPTPSLGLPFVTLLDPSGSPIETSPPKNRDLLGLNYLGLQTPTPPSLKSASAGIAKRQQFVAVRPPIQRAQGWNRPWVPPHSDVIRFHWIVLLFYNIVIVCYTIFVVCCYLFIVLV